MKVTIVQFAPLFGEKDKNIETLDQYVRTEKTDIIIFPELATTGYDFKDEDEVAKLADPFDGEMIEKFADLAQSENKIIVLGFPEKADENGKINYYNSAAVLFPDKKYNDVYRKIHLFFRERFCFSEGNTGFFVINYPDWDLNIGTMICYDWRFPEAARTLGVKGADLVVCPSNLVTNVWNVSTPSRALENKVYLAVANRIGTESRNGKDLLFNGMSVLYSYNSQEIAKASRDQTQVISGEIYPEKTRNKSFNEYNDIFRDRRPEFYK